MKPHLTAKPGARRLPRSAILSALLLALSAGSVYSFVSLSAANRWVRHTDEVRVEVAQLRAMLLDAETGLRGYLVTGESSFLAPFHLARAGWRRQLDGIRSLTTDNADQQSRLAFLEKVIVEDFGAFTGAHAERERYRASGMPLPLMMEHKRAMDAARVLLGDMEAVEATRRDAGA